MELFASINTVSIVLFAVGMVLLLIEMFIPGFGIFGGLGLVALILCIIFQATSFLEGLIMFLVIGGIVVVMVLIAARSFNRGRLSRSQLILKNTEAKEDGYVSNEDYSELVGKTGLSLTPLRPAGIADIDGKKADVVTEGEFIASRVRIEVIQVAGPRIVVKQLED